MVGIENFFLNCVVLLKPFPRYSSLLKVFYEKNYPPHFFTCVDFREKANRFLQYCGVKNEPSPIDVAELLVQSSAELWNSIKNVENYLDILRLIAFDLATISKKSSLIKKNEGIPYFSGCWNER